MAHFASKYPFRFPRRPTTAHWSLSPTTIGEYTIWISNCTQARKP